MLIALAAAALAGLAGLAGGAIGLERRRGRRLAAAAAPRGWTYRARDRQLTRRFDGPPFGVGRVRQATHVLTGTAGGRPVLAFEYRYRQSVPAGPEGSGQVVAVWSVLAVGLPAPLPLLTVTSRGAVGRLVARFLPAELAMESEDFNRRYRVTCAEPRLAYEVLHPRTIAGLLEAPGLDFRLQSADALSYWPGRLALAEVDRRLEPLLRVIDGVPAYVWRDRSA